MVNHISAKWHHCSILHKVFTNLFLSKLQCPKLWLMNLSGRQVFMYFSDCEHRHLNSGSTICCYVYTPQADLKYTHAQTWPVNMHQQISDRMRRLPLKAPGSRVGVRCLTQTAPQQCSGDKTDMESTLHMYSIVAQAGPEPANRAKSQWSKPLLNQASSLRLLEFIHQNNRFY